MKLTDIKFRERIKPENHPRYTEFVRLIGLRDFSAYREVFERGWAETSIMCGEFTRLEELPVEDYTNYDTILSKLMGVNEHTLRRSKFAKEFFASYERQGRRQFLKTVFHTSYIQDLIEHTDHVARGRGVLGYAFLKYRQMRTIRRRVLSFLDLYDKMKTAGTLVGTERSGDKHDVVFKPEDLPWAIDYCAYLKLRDGSHRRAIAHALGWPTIPTLVFEFNRVNLTSLALAHPYLRDNFVWFEAIVRRVASVELHSELLSAK